MAVGFLFLGGGRMSFSQHPEALAALAAAVLPRFAASPADHRHYVQAMRHVYALACEARHLSAYEADARVEVRVALVVELRDSDNAATLSSSSSSSTSSSSGARLLHLVAPCLLPPFEMIARVHLRSPLHHALTLPGGDALRRCLGAGPVCVLRVSAAALVRDARVAREVVALSVQARSVGVPATLASQAGVDVWARARAWAHMMRAAATLSDTHAATLDASINALCGARNGSGAGDDLVVDLTREWFRRPRGTLESHDAAPLAWLRFFGADACGGASTASHVAVAALVYALAAQPHARALEWSVPLVVHTVLELSAAAAAAKSETMATTTTSTSVVQHSTRASATSTARDRFTVDLWRAWARNDRLAAALPPPLPRAMLLEMAEIATGGGKSGDHALDATVCDNIVGGFDASVFALRPRPPLMRT